MLRYIKLLMGPKQFGGLNFLTGEKVVHITLGAEALA